MITSPRRCLLLGSLLLSSACAPPQTPLVALPAQAADALLIRDVAVLDPLSGQRQTGRDVELRDGRIAAIRASGETAASLPSIDGRGATLLPGLIDMHAHVGFSSAPRWAPEIPDPPRNLEAYLYSGVTTVFDVGAMDTQIFKLRRQTASGELPGPRIFAVGPLITAPGGHPAALIDRLAPWWLRWYIKRHQLREVGDPAAAQAAVADVAARGADAIKLVLDAIPEGVPRMDAATMRAAVEAARAQGLRSVTHVGTLSDAIATAEAGAALWVHGVYKERIPDEQIARLAAYGIPLVPTMAVFENYALLGQGPRLPSRLERETVPAELLGAFDEIPADPANEIFAPFLQRLREQRLNWRDNVRRLHAAGVTMMAGSDTQSGVFPGAGLHREMRLLAEAGLSPIEVIRAATLHPARFLAAEEAPDFGRLAVGQRADLLLVEGDPLADLAVLENIRAVILGGRLVERRPLQR